MITLALDTSTPRGAVALLRDEKPVAEVTFERSELFGALQKLAPGQVDLIAVGIGPGSFTGIRAGIAAAKGLALPGAVPIKAVSSFDALAMTALPQMPRDCETMCVLGDARREEQYVALYDRTGRVVRECRITVLETVADEIHNPVWFVSAEIEKYRDVIAELFGGFAVIGSQPTYPSAAALGWLAVQRFRSAGNRGDTTIEPIYLRTPQYKTV